MVVLEKFIKRIEEKSKDNFCAPINIVVLGDSVSQGCMEDGVLDFDNVYHAVLKRMLERRNPQCTFNIINAAIGGECAEHGLRRVDRDVISHCPDLVVVGYCLNDATLGLDYLPEYINNIESIIQRIKNNTQSDIIVLTPNFMAEHDNAAVTDKWRKSLAVIVDTQKSGTLKKFAEALKDSAKMLAVPVADVYARWEKMAISGKDTTAMLCNGLNHPDVFRQRLIAKTVFELIYP